MESQRRASRAAGWWWLAGFGCLVPLAALLVWDAFATPPAWSTWPAVALLVSGATSWAVAAALQSRAERISPLRMVGRVLWAPIRFLLEL